jgi:hypothetical protein
LSRNAHRNVHPMASRSNPHTYLTGPASDAMSTSS